MASMKAEKAVGSKPAGQAKREPVKAPVSKAVSTPVPKAAVSIPIPSTALQQASGLAAAPHAPPSPPVPTAAPKAPVSTPVSRLAPKKVEQKPQEPKKKVTGTKPAPAKKM